MDWGFLESKRVARSKEEMALRKSEHARRRKVQSEQKAEQLKASTTNKILSDGDVEHELV